MISAAPITHCINMARNSLNLNHAMKMLILMSILAQFVVSLQVVSLDIFFDASEWKNEEIEFSSIPIPLFSCSLEGEVKLQHDPWILPY